MKARIDSRRGILPRLMDRGVCRGFPHMSTRQDAASTLVSIALVAWLALPISAAEWNQWRGPERDGHVPDFTAPESWPKQLKRQWKIEVGLGHSSPVLAGDRVLTFSRQGENEVARAVSLADGKELWSHGYPASYRPSPYALTHGKGPKSTPVAAGNRLITVGVSSIVCCWAVDSGKLLWRRDFSKQFKVPTSLFYGMAASPIIVGQTVVATVGVADDGAVAAMDLDTGRDVWKWDGDGAAYTSPLLTTLAGARQLITQSQGASISVDPSKGGLFWTMPFKTEYDQNIITPLLADDLVVFTGLKKGTTAYRIQKNGDKLTPERVWHNDEISMFMSSPVAVGKHIYGLANRAHGQFFCLDAATGKTLWTSEGRMGENAAILAADKVLLALTTNSELIVLRANPERFERLASYTVSDTPTWAHPAVTGNKILIKDRDTLALWTVE
jgi:outer membrane protein assembly factor BamB